MKKLLIFSVFVFTLLSCKQNIQNSASEINITVKVDAGIKLKDDKPIKAKKGGLWKELKTIADSKIETKKEYTFREWKLKDEKGKALSDDYAFNQDEVVYAVSVLVQKNARITIKGDERLSIIGDDFININIFVPKTFKDVEDKIKAKLSLKPEWNNGDYDIFDWKLNDENGELILEDTLITETMTIFARTNYVKFKIEDTTISDYIGEGPRGRIIIPKEITKVTGLSSCGEIISVDLSLCKELTELILCYTGITSIDVSNNTKLTLLNLGNTGITSIDVSKNTELAELYLYCTKITSIDVSKNEKLTWLSLGNTGITSIDVSNNTELVKLYLYDTKITSIDVSKSTKLKYVSFTNCSNLTAVDLSACTALDTIGGLCFSGLANAVVTLPSSIKIIESMSFGATDDNYCKKVIVPNNEIKQLLLRSGYPEARIEVKS